MVRFDERFAFLKARVLGYEADPSGGNRPEMVTMRAEVLDVSAALGPIPGTEVTIGMSEHPGSANRLIADLMTGCDAPARIHACPPGSVVEFSGCTWDPEGDVLQATAFRIIEVAEEATPSFGR